MSFLPGGVYNFQSVTSTPTPLVVANKIAYVCAGSSLLSFQLPTTCLAGFSFKIIGEMCLWKILQNTSQFITFGSINTTTGTSGSLSSLQNTDKVEVTCLVQNTNFDVSDAFGNITVI